METLPESSRESQAEIAPSWLDFEVSIVANAHAVETKNIRVGEALEHIRNGKYAEEVDRIRATTENERKKLKKMLPAVMWSRRSRAAFRPSVVTKTSGQRG